jgi:hypothetical protein
MGVLCVNCRAATTTDTDGTMFPVTLLFLPIIRTWRVIILDLLSSNCRRVKLVFVNYEALISEIENILRKLIYYIISVISYLDASNGTDQLWQ